VLCREGKCVWFGKTRTIVALLAALAAGASLSACGSDEKEVTLRVGGQATPEGEVLGQVYAQSLRQAGYEVRASFEMPEKAGQLPLEEVRNGLISGYPEYVDEVLRESLAIEEEKLPNDSQEAYKMAKTGLEKKGLTAFPPTPFNLSRPVGVLRSTAKERNLRTVSDLEGDADEMTLLGPTDCHFKFDCLAGIERYYDIYFKGIHYTYTQRDVDRRYEVLENGEFDAVILNSTEGRLHRDKDKFVLLEDDKQAFPAGNAIFVTSPKVIEKAGPELREAIVDAQEGLTLPVMRELNAEVELEGKDPAEVAASYLKRVEP
jgi:glycine betaine/choline ABC-type transport system substrate-binding protein